MTNILSRATAVRPCFEIITGEPYVQVWDTNAGHTFHFTTTISLINHYAVHRASNGKSDFQTHSRSLAIVLLDRLYVISYLIGLPLWLMSCTVFQIFSLISQNVKTSRDRDCAHLRDNLSSHYVTWRTSVQNLKCLPLAVPVSEIF